MFERRKQKKVVTERLQILRNSGINLTTSVACDEVSPHGLNRWHEINDKAIKFYLNKVSLEQEILHVYKSACMRLTRNFSSGACQGHLCVVKDIPDNETLILWLATPGFRTLPPLGRNGDRLFQENGWTEFEVKKNIWYYKKTFIHFFNQAQTVPCQVF